MRHAIARPRSTTDRASDAFLAYVEPEELAGPILRDPLPFDTQVLDRGDDGGVAWTELCFLSEVYRGAPIFMHAWLCQPVQANGPGKQSPHRFPALLVIPGGRGVTEKDLAIWLARTCGVMALGVDWIGTGKSSQVPGLDPWTNAIRFDGEDYRDSFQFRNLRAY